MAKVYVMCGVPGSGKSTYAHSIADDLDAIVVSSDDVRAELYGDASCQANPARVFNEVYRRAHEIVDSNLSVIIDATNIKRKDRRRIVKEFPYNEIVALVMNTPLEVCLERNENRDRVVPRDVIRKMYDNFELPSRYEGFKVIEDVCGY